jgi:hypothetical protein
LSSPAECTNIILFRRGLAISPRKARLNLHIIGKIMSDADQSPWGWVRDRFLDQDQDQSQDQAGQNIDNAGGI